ncbi:heavy metal translocating P-type ATPase [Sphingobacterium corticis]|uniref:P-type Zn(2+) transporter n=1 Tax=Sphingobacterium corticis TaxID=1812823 RepID=A0ABW5NHU8_9SPHI
MADQHAHPTTSSCCCESHVENLTDSHNPETNRWKLFLPSIIALILLLSALSYDHFIANNWFENEILLAWYVLAYAIVGFPVLKDAWRSIRKGDVFSEFFLMGIATLGAFYIGQYLEAVAVMLFYSVGEAFQNLAVSRAKTNIQTLLDQRPDQVTTLVNGKQIITKAAEVGIGTILQLKSGEKLALDGELISERASFDTAALTGESKPNTKFRGQEVLAGMINLNAPSQVRVGKAYTDSKLSKILELVQHATTQKAPTELFIRKFAKIYTPIVVFLALGIWLLPYFFVDNYVFETWLYRALVFLVLSCPCALVISIPLGYFGGIGAASRHGILCKGSNFLDVLANVDHVVMDKTGTMTEGIFQVQQVSMHDSFDKTRMLDFVNALESYSSHPIASAIKNYVGDQISDIKLDQVEEIAGQGLRAFFEGKELLVGNFKLMDRFEVSYDMDPKSLVYTTIAIAFDGKFAGHITIADRIKHSAADTIRKLSAMNIKTTMLSGDKSSVVEAVANDLKIDAAHGELLPEDKVRHFEAIKRTGATVAFVGDGLNDAPVVALSDVGIAMGGLGSDATVETADVIIQDDNPYKIPIAIQIGKKTRQIVWQNIALAFFVKAMVLILGAGGLASMWEAVFADVGVALLAILNAIRIQRGDFL